MHLISDSLVHFTVFSSAADIQLWCSPALTIPVGVKRVCNAVDGNCGSLTPACRSCGMISAMSFLRGTVAESITMLEVLRQLNFGTVGQLYKSESCQTLSSRWMGPLEKPKYLWGVLS